MHATGGDRMTDRRRGLLPEDLVRFEWLEEIALSPDGRRVAFTTRHVDVAGNGYVTHVNVHDLEGGSTVRVSGGGSRNTSLAWSRDGAALAWVESVGDRSSLHVRGGSFEGVYSLDGQPLAELNWHPNGRQLAASRWVRSVPQPVIETVSGSLPTTVKAVQRLRYKQDGVGWVHDRFSQVVLVDLATERVRQLTHGEADHSEPQWSQRGDRLAFVVLAREQDEALGQGQIYVWDAGGGAAPRALIPGWQGACRSPVWGLDDGWIAFAGHEHPAPTNRRIFMVPYAIDLATDAVRQLAPGLDQEVGNYAASDSRKGLSNITVKWPGGDPWVYFLVTEQGATHLYRTDVEANLERVTEGPSVTFEYSPAAGGRVAYGLSDPSSPGELFVVDAGGHRCVTDLNPWLGDHRLSRPEEYWFDGVDGSRVHGWIMKPPGGSGGGRRPAVFYVHCSMFSWDFSHEFQCITSRGYVLTYFNQRGTTAGYGQAWTRASEGDQGGADYVETMLGVDHVLREHPEIDPDRLGVTGGSCGGFMTNWIVGHTDRFRAAVTQRSVVNQISFFGTSDIGPEGTERETATNPWTDLEASWRQSPLAYAKDVNTPLLIVHSSEDHRCALEQAEQLFAALRWQRKPVEMVVFEGENHGLSRGGRPGNRIERLRRIIGWFDTHIGPHPTPAPSTSGQGA